jgi:hypothetical protein
MLTYDYITDVDVTTSPFITIPGTEHRLGTAALDIAVKMPSEHGLVDYPTTYGRTVNPETFDVVIAVLSNNHHLVIILTKQQALLACHDGGQPPHRRCPQ